MSLSHTPNSPTTLSWTGAKRFRECPLQFKRRFVERLPEILGEPLERGIATHTVLERIGRAAHAGSPLTDAQLAIVTAEAMAVIAPAAADDAREILCRYLEQGGIPGLPSDAQDVAFEYPFAIDRDGQAVDWDDPAAMIRSVLDRVYRENGGTLAVIDDYKTNWVIEQPGEQMRIYAYAACCLWPEVEEVVVRLRFVRYGQCSREEVIGRDEALAFGATIVALHDAVIDAVNADAFPARVSNACLQCSFTRSCPEMAREASPRQLSTADDARAAADDLVRLTVRGKEIAEQLAAFVGLNGPIDLGTETYGPVSRAKESVEDAGAVAALLAERGVDSTKLWSEVSIPKAALSKLVTAAIASAPKGEKKSAREAVMQELRDDGALKTRTDIELRRTKKTDELPAEEA